MEILWSIWLLSVRVTNSCLATLVIFDCVGCFDQKILYRCSKELTEWTFHVVSKKSNASALGYLHY